MKYSDEQRIIKMYDYAAKLGKYLVENGVTEGRLMAEIELQWLVTTPLYNIGEHAYNLSKEFKEAHPETEWAMIAGLRHRLIHDYEGTNWKIIAQVVFEELPKLKEQLEKLK